MTVDINVYIYIYYTDMYIYIFKHIVYVFIHRIDELPLHGIQSVNPDGTFLYA